MNVAGYGSVFDWQAGQFRVYQLPNVPALMSEPVFCQPGVRPTAVGVDVTAALCPLPPGARFIGMSKVATGQLMRQPGGVVGAPVGIRGLSGIEPALSGGGLGQIAMEAVVVSVLVNVVAALVTPHVVKFVTSKG